MKNHLLGFITLTLYLMTNNTYAGENDLYDFLWLDPDKSVYVLQNKVYEKKKSLYVDVGLGTSLTSNFQSTNAAQLKFGYYFHEEWAVEYNFLQYSNSNNSAYDNIIFVNEAEPFIRRPLSSHSLFLIYSPFYGKINTFNKIYYFDISFGVGTGTFSAESNLKTAPFEDQFGFEKETFTPLLLKTNIKFHINKSLHLGVEFLSTNFEARSDPENQNKKSFKRNNDLIFSLGVSF